MPKFSGISFQKIEERNVILRKRFSNVLLRKNCPPICFDFADGRYCERFSLSCISKLAVFYFCFYFFLVQSEGLMNSAYSAGIYLFTFVSIDTTGTDALMDTAYTAGKTLDVLYFHQS